MKLKKATDYAFIVLAHLGKIPLGKSTNNKEIAKVFKIPESFLANIVHNLSKSGIIKARKGMNGGICLARKSSEITLREVIEAIEGNVGLVDCQKSDGVCKLDKTCNVKQFWNIQHEKILAAFNDTKLEDLINIQNSGTKKTSVTVKRLKL